jgi:hypothetical protein
MLARPTFALMFAALTAHSMVDRYDGAAAADAHGPCLGKACGQPCQACPPDEADCLETAISKYCNEEGACAPVRPMCAEGL